MQAAGGQQRIEVTQIGAEHGGRDGGVLPPGVRRTGQADAGQARAVRADPPQPGGFALIEDQLRGKAAGRLHEATRALGQTVRIGVGEFNEKPAVSGRKVRHGVRAPPATHHFEDAAIETLDRGGSRPSTRGVASAAAAMSAPDHDEQPVWQVLDQAQPGTGDHGERAFAADQESRHVEAVLRQQVFQAVAGDLPREPAELGADHAEVRLHEFLQCGQGR